MLTYVSVIIIRIGANFLDFLMELRDEHFIDFNLAKMKGSMFILDIFQSDFVEDDDAW